MARVVVSPAAAEDLEGLIFTHNLPVDAKARVVRSIRPLADFPLLGAELPDAWEGFRFLLGPWRWMVIVYAYDDEKDEISVVTIQDGRALGRG